MELLDRINNLIKKFTKNGTPKSISKKSVLQELESVADLFLGLECIRDEHKIIGIKLWDISQKIKQPRDKVLRTLRAIKKILSSYDIKRRLGNQHFISGRVVVFHDKQNYSAYNELKNFFVSAKKSVDLIDPYLYPDTFQILGEIPEKLKIRLITNLDGFYKNSKIDFNKFKKEYSIEAKSSKMIHDRFFIIDGNGYFSGSSLHSVGNKLSAIAFMNESDTKILQKEFNKIWNQSKKIQ